MATRLSQYRTAQPATLERRAEPRHRIYLSRVTVKNRGVPREAELYDLSIYGCRVSCATRYREDERVRLSLFGGASVEARVIWCNDGYIGCRFVVPIPSERVRALTLGIG
jgi:hypothetical protein